MRPNSIFFSCLFTILTVQSVSAFELGTLAIGGTGCFGSAKLIPIDGQEGRYALPLRVRLNKKADVAFDRKSCNIRLPVSLNPNEQLQIVDLSQAVRVFAAKGSDVKSTLNLSVLGKKTNPLVLEVKATDDDSSVIQNVKAEGVVVESACGKDAMITGDLNILATGTAKALASTGTALLTLKVVTCN